MVPLKSTSEKAIEIMKVALRWSVLNMKHVILINWLMVKGIE
jgi:hypothetical protein